MRAIRRHQFFPVHQHPQILEHDVSRRRLLVNLRQEFVERHLEQKIAAATVTSFMLCQQKTIAEPMSEFPALDSAHGVHSDQHHSNNP